MAILNSTVIEGSQVLLHVGIFDIDDVILNGVGVLLGYGLQIIFVRLFHTTASRAMALVIAAIIMIAAVYLTATALQGGREPVRPGHDVRIVMSIGIDEQLSGRSVSRAV
jgi:hypothetical protein